MEANKKGSGLGKFVLKNVEIGFYTFQAIVVDLRCFVMHRHEIFIIFSDVFRLGLVSAFKY